MRGTPGLPERKPKQKLISLNTTFRPGAHFARCEKAPHHENEQRDD